MTPKQFFIKVQHEFDKLKQGELARIVQVEAQKQWNTHFERGGFEDSSFTPWKPRKDDADPERGLLVKTGTLRKHARRGRIQNGKDVVFDFPLAYERAQNFGETFKGSVTVKAHTRKGKEVKSHSRNVDMSLPQRQFIGESAVLNEKIKQKVIQTINKIR